MLEQHCSRTSVFAQTCSDLLSHTRTHTNRSAVLHIPNMTQLHTTLYRSGKPHTLHNTLVLTVLTHILKVTQHTLPDLTACPDISFHTHTHTRQKEAVIFIPQIMSLSTTFELRVKRERGKKNKSV